MTPFPHHHRARLSGGPIAYAELTAGRIGASGGAR